MKTDFTKSEQSRQQLFSLIQKLKGSMRVYCRVKPLPLYENNRLSTHEIKSSINVVAAGPNDEVPISLEL